MTSPYRLSPPAILVAGVLSAAIGACSLRGPTPVSGSPSPAPATPQASPTSMPVEASNVVLLVAAPAADPVLVARLRQSLTDLTGSSQLSLQTTETLTAEQLSARPRVVVATGDDTLTGIDPPRYPETQFVAVGIAGLKPGPNLTLVGPNGLIPDQVGFLAGYLAALITPDYRVAVVSPDDTPSRTAASLAFINGATFYCGLCQPTVPPFKAYPLAFPLAVDPGSLQAEGIRTAFVIGGDAASLEQLAGLGIDLVGEVTAPEAIKARWVATVFADPEPALREVWSSLLEGQGGRSLSLQPTLVDIRPGAVSPGRMRLVEETIAALVDGKIDTAVDPATGQPR